MTYCFVVRTDLSPDSGSQRCFGMFDSESDASEFAVRIASQHFGDFAVVGPAPVAVNVVRQGGLHPVVAVPMEGQ
ncbi:MAG: hypothetical protein WBH00_13305 [Xanthobacteraceae bacterium]